VRSRPLTSAPIGELAPIPSTDCSAFTNSDVVGVVDFAEKECGREVRQRENIKIAMVLTSYDQLWTIERQTNHESNE
jgi:hypothetical protein